MQARETRNFRRKKKKKKDLVFKINPKTGKKQMRGWLISLITIVLVIVIAVSAVLIYVAKAGDSLSGSAGKVPAPKGFDIADYTFDDAFSTVTPKILTGGKKYPSDHVSGLGPGSNQTNFNVARYAEALLLYAEACIGADEAAGLKALNAVQERSGSGKISSSLSIEAVMEEKQYEMWFENCRFHDLVRWSKKYPNLVNLDQVFNKSGIHDRIPTVFDEFFIESKPGYQKYHKLYTEYSTVKAGFVTGKHEYYPFPHDFLIVNPMLKNVGGWEGVE